MPGFENTVFISLVVVGLNCCTQDLRFTEAGGTWFPDQESNRGPLHWEPGVSAARQTPREVLQRAYFEFL